MLEGGTGLLAGVPEPRCGCGLHEVRPPTLDVIGDSTRELDGLAEYVTSGSTHP